MNMNTWRHNVANYVAMLDSEQILKAIAHAELLVIQSNTKGRLAARGLRRRAEVLLEVLTTADTILRVLKLDKLLATIQSYEAKHGAP